MQAVSVSFFRFAGTGNRLWAFAQMQFARAGLRAMDGIGFFKLFGTGTGEGFTPVPNPGVYAILATWPSLEVARRSVADGAVYGRWRDHAVEHATLYLSAVASRGSWDKQAPFATDPGEGLPRPIAVLTRATVKARHVLAFWRQTPDISATVRAQDRLLFKIGMGEVPWLQQVTFSVWDDPAAMVAFAQRSASHHGAVQQVRRKGWFREELYARFRVLAHEGTWEGRDPLAGRQTSPVGGTDRPLADAGYPATV